MKLSWGLIFSIVGGIVVAVKFRSWELGIAYFCAVAVISGSIQ